MGGVKYTGFSASEGEAVLIEARKQLALLLYAIEVTINSFFPDCQLWRFGFFINPSPKQ